MHKPKAAFFSVLLVISLAVCAMPVWGQSNELAVSVGGYFPVNSQIGASNALAVGGSFAHRIASVPFISAYIEVPVFATFSSTADAYRTVNGTPSYSTLFVTPGLKIKLAPAFPVSPWVVAGGGIAHFSKSHVATDDSTYSGTFEVGGGIDWKIFPFFSARTGVRDFYTGNPDIVTGFSSREHQLIASVGLVLRF